MTNAPTDPTLVIGVGRSLTGDAAAGPAVIGRLRSEWHFSPVPDLIDGFTRDGSLGDRIAAAGGLLIITAIDSGLQPGQITEMDGSDLGRLFEALTAAGETDLVLALAIASWQQVLPDDIRLLAIQPQSEATDAFSPRVAARLDALLLKAIRRLENWGHAAWRSAPMAVHTHA